MNILNSTEKYSSKKHSFFRYCAYCDDSDGDVINISGVWLHGICAPKFVSQPKNRPVRFEVSLDNPDESLHALFDRCNNCNGYELKRSEKIGRLTSLKSKLLLRTHIHECPKIGTPNYLIYCRGCSHVVSSNVAVHNKTNNTWTCDHAGEIF